MHMYVHLYVRTTYAYIYMYRKYININKQCQGNNATKGVLTIKTVYCGMTWGL